MGDNIACTRCRHIGASSDPYSTICDECVWKLRAIAAFDGQAIQATFDPDADHRSPGERRRED